MRLTIVAVGRLKSGGERELVDRYAARLAGIGRGQGLGPLEEREIPESRGQTVALRCADEAGRLVAKARSASCLLALDERGKAMTSSAFATELRRLRDLGEAELALLIGGPDGHGEEVLSAARMTLSLGPMTLPHGLARAVLAEQIYRAATILAGHPYHRE